MEIWHFHGKRLHMQKLPNTIQRIPRQKRKTQLQLKLQKGKGYIKA